MSWLFSRSAARREALRERKQDEPPSGFDQVVWLIVIILIAAAIYQLFIR